MAIDIIARGMAKKSNGDVNQLAEQFNFHTNNEDIHVTTTDKNKWNIAAESGYAVTGISSYTLNNAVDYPLLGLNLYGKSTQDGTPTPDAPVDIVSVGDNGSVSVQVCGKNLLNPTLKTTTINGIICTNNGDGTYTLNGTAEKETYFRFGGIDSIIDKTYMLVCSPVGYNKTTYIAFFTNSVNGYENQPYVSKSTRLSVELVIKSGIALNNTIFKPMITTDLSATYDDFEPHISTTATITSALPLCGIPVDSDGNYTDSIGQQWVADELVYNADGTGSIIKNTAKIESYNGEAITAPFISTTGGLTTGATVIYQTDAPQEIALTASDVSALMQLRTYSGVTDISNSGNADMDVKYCTNKMLSEYVMPVITGLQKQIDELRAAILSMGGNV